MSIPTITSKDLANLLQQQPALPLIDVRTPAEFRGAHVVGATNVPLDRLTSQRLEETLGEQRNGTVYFICKGGTRSHMACRKAHAFGLSNVVNVEGGTNDCIATGLPVQSERETISLDRQVRITAGSLVLLGAVLAWQLDPDWVALSAFIGAGLVFSGITNTCLMGDVLARMPWNQ